MRPQAQGEESLFRGLGSAYDRVLVSFIHKRLFLCYSNSRRINKHMLRLSRQNHLLACPLVGRKGESLPTCTVFGDSLNFRTNLRGPLMLTGIELFTLGWQSNLLHNSHLLHPHSRNRAERTTNTGQKEGSRVAESTRYRAEYERRRRC